MSRYTGPTTRMNRKFGMAVFAPSKAFERRPYLPGQHGQRHRRKVSDYAVGLLEKQKLRFMYGLTEKQFRLAFKRAKKRRGVTGEIFLQILETRLDNVIYLLGFAKTRPQARQFVNHGHIRVDGHKVDISSYQVSAGEEIEVKADTSSRQLATRCLEETRMRTMAAWLTRNDDALRAKINRLPEAKEIEPGVNMQLIVEFYSR